jgi:hypothetical protein
MARSQEALHLRNLARYALPLEFQAFQSSLQKGGVQQLSSGHENDSLQDVLDCQTEAVIIAGGSGRASEEQLKSRSAAVSFGRFTERSRTPSW